MDTNDNSGRAAVNSPEEQDPFIAALDAHYATDASEIDWGTAIVVPIEPARQRRADTAPMPSPAQTEKAASTGKKAKADEKPKKEKEEAFELVYAKDMAANHYYRVGGPTGDCAGGVDKTIYRWLQADDGAYWRVCHPDMLTSDALQWLGRRYKAFARERAGESCAATFTTWMLGMGKEKWMPPVDRKRNLIPTRGHYLEIMDDGAIRALTPSADMGMTFGVNARINPSRIDADGVYQPAPVDPQSRFGRYLASTFNDDEVRAYAQEAFSTVLINRCFEKSLWLYGPGENGKSVLVHIMTAVVGGRAAPIKLDNLVRNQFGTSTLQGARLATVAEVPKVLCSAIQDALKELISWDAQPLERKGRDAFTFTPNAVWILCSNAFPRVSQHEHGFWRKVLTLPFLNRVSEADKIQDFHKLITDDEQEMAQVIDWLLEGAQRLIRRGGKFGPMPSAIADLAKRQRTESDNVLGFFEATEAAVSSTEWTSKMAIYRAYCEHCIDRTAHPLGETQFWVNARAHFPAADLDGKKGPALGPKKARERYVRLAVIGAEPLPASRVPDGWDAITDDLASGSDDSPF